MSHLCFCMHSVDYYYYYYYDYYYFIFQLQLFFEVVTTVPL